MNPPNDLAGLLPEAWRSYQRGDLARAEQLSRQALSGPVGRADAFHLLGIIASRAGQLENAISWLRQAAEDEPRNAGHHCDLAVLLSSAGRLEEAVASYQESLRLQPDSALTHNNLSYTFYLMRHFDEAKASAQEALRLKPDYAEAHNHMGLAFQGLGQHEEAVAQFQNVLRLNPGLVEVNRNLGGSLEALGKFEEAATCYEHALRIKPDFAEMHSDIGDVLKKLGRFDEAIAHLKQALRFRPNYAFVYWNLSQFSVSGLFRFSADDLERMLVFLREGRLTLMEGSLFHLALGNVLDAQGQYDAAFQHFAKGAIFRKEWLRQVGDSYDPAAHHLLVDRIKTTCDESFFRQERTKGSDSELPIFVIGMPRSGTTLVEQILSSHSQVAGAGELTLIDEMANGLARSGAYPESLRTIDHATLRELSERHLGNLKRIGGHAIRVIDKRPDNFLHLGLIARLFPKAKIIHCQRDPLDVCLSCYFQHFNRIGYSWSLEDLGHYHGEYERLMAHWKQILPLHILDVAYEDLVSRQEATTREMLAFCGLEWQEQCLAFHKNKRPVETVSAVQVRQPIYASSVGRWRKYAQHLAPLRKALALPID